MKVQMFFNIQIIYFFKNINIERIEKHKYFYMYSYKKKKKIFYSMRGVFCPLIVLHFFIESSFFGFVSVSKGLQHGSLLNLLLSFFIYITFFIF